MRVRWVRVVSFWVVTVLVSYAVAWLATPLRVARDANIYAWAAAANLLMLVPGLVACAFLVFVAYGRLRSGLGLAWTPNRWWMVAWLLPAVIAVAAMGMALLMPGASFTPLATGPWAALPLPQPWGGMLAGLLAGATICFPGALGEELAWRGFLRRELEPLGFWPSCLVVGLAWWGWHLPPYIHADKGPALAVTIAVATPIVMFLRDRGRSVLAAALFHGSMSATWLLPELMVRRGALAHSASWIPGLICAGLVALAVRRDRQRLAASQRPGP